MLACPQGEPRNIQSVADLAQPGLKIVNRQPGTGTRLLLDLELKKAGLDGRRLRAIRENYNATWMSELKFFQVVQTWGRQ